MAEFPVRKIEVITEEIFHEGGPAPEEPRRRAAAMALVKNPFAGRYVERLQSAMEDLKPLGHTNAAYVRSHFDAMEVGIADGPRPDEILFILAMSIGPRVHNRMGGLAADEIKAWDGLR